MHQECSHHRNDKKRFICPLCDRGFTIRQDLLVHIVSGTCKRADRLLRRVTSGWECNSCNKHFDTRNKAECHTRTHTFGSGITCPVCNMDFIGCKGNVVLFSRLHSYGSNSKSNWRSSSVNARSAATTGNS